MIFVKVLITSIAKKSTMKQHFTCYEAEMLDSFHFLKYFLKSSVSRKLRIIIPAPIQGLKNKIISPTTITAPLISQIFLFGGGLTIILDIVLP